MRFIKERFLERTFMNNAYNHFHDHLVKLPLHAFWILEIEQPWKQEIGFKFFRHILFN